METNFEASKTLSLKALGGLKKMSKLSTLRAGINTFRIPSAFLTCIRIAFKFIGQEQFSRMCIRICYRVTSCEKREVRVSNSNSMVLRIFHVCVCVLNS